MTFAQPFSDYEILDRVGAGAMGTVFKARQKRMSRIVALKVLRPSLARDERYVDRLRREARIVAALNHPHIVTGYDLGEEGGYHFFVMEFIEGKSLRALLSEWGIFAEEEVLKVGIQVAQALDHAFQRGVIHRDIKPANILIDEQGNVKLTDMGLAKGPADLTLTRDGATVGTPQYISPEQARNPQDVDVRSDLYSLGATLYHMATGQPPFRGESLAEVITKVLHEVPPPPRALNPALGEGLSLVIRKLLAKNVQLRYQTPRELLDDLLRVQQSQPPAVDEQRLLAGESATRPTLRAWALGLTGAALLAVGAFWYGIHLRGDAPSAPAADEFLLALARDLDGIPSLRGKWQRLLHADLEAPAGSAVGLETQKRSIAGALAQSVEAAVAELQGDQWPTTLRWLADPERWPSIADFERERISKVLSERTGFLAEQLPQSVSAASIAALRAAAAQAIAARDEALLVRARHYLSATLPTRADERRANGDFRAAERIWREGLLQFCDGRQEPRLERVADPVRQQIVQMFDRLADGALRQLEVAEAAVADALRREAEAGIALLEQRARTGADPEALALDLKRLRDELGQAYPAAGRFRADPWVEVDRKLQACERTIAAAGADFARRRTERALDCAWRLFCSGDAAAALDFVPALPGDARVEQHRRALIAGGRVAEAMVRALVQHPPVPGHLRDSALVLELTAVSEPAGLRLLASAGGGVPRTARVTEFRFGDLWREVANADPRAVADLPRDQRELGQAVLGLVGDELSAGGPLAEALPPFLREEVYPRIARVRGDSGAAVLAQAEAMRRLEDAWRRARAGSDLRELDQALMVFDARAMERADADDRARIQAATAWRDAERARQQRLADVRASAPNGARVEVAAQDGGLEALVTIDGAALLSGATDSWGLHDAVLECAGVGNARAEDMVRCRLDLASGLPAASRRVECTLDLVFPPATAGARQWVLDFRGTSVLLLVTADDKLRAAPVEGDPRRDDAVHAASLRALAAALDDSAHVRVLPGAVHRLQLRIDASPNRARGVARVLLDQSEVCVDEQAVLDPLRPPNLTIYPLQIMQLRAVQFRGSGF